MNPPNEMAASTARQMSGAGDVERRGRLALSLLASPADPVLGAALRPIPAAEILAAATGSDSCSGAVPTRFWTRRCSGPCAGGGRSSVRCPLWPGSPPGRSPGCGC